MHVGSVGSMAISVGVWLELCALLGAGWKDREGLPSSEMPKGAREAGERLASRGAPPGRVSGARRGLTRGEDWSLQQPQQGLGTTWALPRSSWLCHCFRWPHRWQVRAE